MGDTKFDKVDAFDSVRAALALMGCSCDVCSKAQESLKRIEAEIDRKGEPVATDDAWLAKFDMLAVLWKVSGYVDCHDQWLRLREHVESKPVAAPQPEAVPADGRLRELRDDLWSSIPAIQRLHDQFLPGGRFAQNVDAPLRMREESVRINLLIGVVEKIDRLLATPEPADGRLRELRSIVSKAMARNVESRDDDGFPHPMRDVFSERVDVMLWFAREIDRLLATPEPAAAPKPEPVAAPSASADGDGYNALDHAMAILRKCVAPYSAEQAQAVAKALRQSRNEMERRDVLVRDLAAEAERLRKENADLRAKLHQRTEAFSVVEAKNAAAIAVLRAKLEAAEAKAAGLRQENNGLEHSLGQLRVALRVDDRAPWNDMLDAVSDLRAKLEEAEQRAKANMGLAEHWCRTEEDTRHQLAAATVDQAAMAKKLDEAEQRFEEMDKALSDENEQIMAYVEMAHDALRKAMKEPCVPSSDAPDARTEATDGGDEVLRTYIDDHLKPEIRSESFTPGCMDAALAELCRRELARKGAK